MHYAEFAEDEVPITKTHPVFQITLTHPVSCLKWYSPSRCVRPSKNTRPTSGRSSDRRLGNRPKWVAHCLISYHQRWVTWAIGMRAIRKRAFQKPLGPVFGDEDSIHLTTWRFQERDMIPGYPLRAALGSFGCLVSIDWHWFILRVTGLVWQARQYRAGSFGCDPFSFFVVFFKELRDKRSRENIWGVGSLISCFNASWMLHLVSPFSSLAIVLPIFL